MRIVRSAIQTYYSLNAPYTDLKAQIAQANESINLPANANGDKATFKAVIDKAQGLINKTTAEYNEELAQQMKDAKTELADAQSAFESTTAAFNNPSEIQLVNPFFEGAKKGSIPTGWNGVMDKDGNAKWKGGSNKNYENGTFVCSWKGYTYFPKNSVAQQVNVLKSGVYVLSCQTICYNENAGKDGDRNTHSGVFYYGKLTEGADSIAAHMIHTNRNVGYYPEIYAVVYDKADEAETSIELGFNALSNTCCNQYTFGGNHLRYMGPKAKFDTDLAAALAASLEKGAAMYQSIASFENDATVESKTDLTYGNIYINLGHAVEYAQAAETASQKMTAYYQLEDAIKNANVVVTGVKGIIVEPVAKIQKGVYTLTGVKVADNAANLPQGLYIVNGKKVIVK